MSNTNYASLTVVELKELCSKRSLSVTNLRKNEIIEVLIANDEEVKIQKEEFQEKQRNTQKNETTVETGVLEVIPEGYGFLRMDNYLSSQNDVFVPPAQIKRFRLKTGDKITGQVKAASPDEKYRPLIYVHKINDDSPDKMYLRKNFEDLVPIYPNERITLETEEGLIASRLIDLAAPIGKGQRGMIVAPPKVGKTTLIKEMANSITKNNPNIYLIVLLIDERPEEVTDIRRSIVGEQVDVIYSTFDEVPEHHKKVTEMTLERAKRLVEHNKDVVILLDSITRLARAYNILVPQSGRTLSGGLDPNALHMPKKFFGAARNIENGGSLTIIATSLVETGSKMDDVIFEEFKGTGNMEIVLDRKLAQRRIFPSMDIQRSGTRRDDLLLSIDEQECISQLSKLLQTMQPHDFISEMIKYMQQTDSNKEFMQFIKKVTKDLN